MIAHNNQVFLAIDYRSHFYQYEYSSTCTLTAATAVSVALVVVGNAATKAVINAYSTTLSIICEDNIEEVTQYIEINNQQSGPP